MNHNFKEKDRVKTHLGETGTIKGFTFMGEVVVEIDNSKDTHIIKRWLGNIKENYSPHQLTKID